MWIAGATPAIELSMQYSSAPGPEIRQLRRQGAEFSSNKEEPHKRDVACEHV
jgi:hypothetical protein